jgi:predicted  nucleic acid-binding Zn-ribbon protein
MDQVLQAIRELKEQVEKVQNQMTLFETNVNERFERLENRMDGLENRMDKLETKMVDIIDENQRDTQDNIMTLVQENWDHEKDLQKVKRRVGMDLI